MLQAPLDLTRVVTIGHSAGGHLAALAATRDGPSVQVTGVVSQAGVLDLERAWEWRLSNGVVRRLLGGTPEQRPERYAAASPAARLPLGVPALLTHGGKDDIVPPAMSEAFHRATGCDLVLLPEEDHYGHLDPGEPACGRRWSSGSAEPRASAAARCDDADPLRGFRDRFVDDDPTRIYLDGNSLGRLPLATRDRLAAIVAAVGRASSSPAGTTGSTRPRASATCWPSTSSARAPAR